MPSETLLRTLWYEHQLEIVEVDQSFLIDDPRPLIVLGEAGMGKSTLLASASEVGGYAFCTARQLINRPNPLSLIGDASTLVIDALDEVSASREGDAVDLVLRKLGELGYPRFILSCRVADWRSATGLQGIEDHYTAKPLELHLSPLTREDAVSFLNQTLPADVSEQAVGHLEQRGLDGLWNNPQTLMLVERVVGAGGLPASKGDLFASAIPLLRTEHREEKGHASLSMLSEEEVLGAAGAAFASLVVGGKDAITRRVLPAEDDLPLVEVATLPGASRLGEALGARLFESRGAERFTYAHRAIGEFLGAHWLVKCADTPRKQKRLLALFQGRSLVPASLRGIHAWLGWHSSTLAPAVIAADPMGVIEYGDADKLSTEQGRSLLVALAKLSQENPQFRDWGSYRVGGIIQKALLPEIRDLITSPKTEFGLRLLVLQALKHSSLAAELADALRVILLDQSAIFANRSEAGDRLAELSVTSDWLDIIEALLAQGDENGVRLGVEMMGEVGYHRFDAELICDAVFAQVERSENHYGVYFSVQKNCPDYFLDAVLDRVAARCACLGKPYERLANSELTDLAYGLIARRLKLEPIEPQRLWNWLWPFDCQLGYHRENRNEIAEWIKTNVGVRQAIQRHVLFEVQDEKTVSQRAWRLRKRSLGLAPTEQDVLALLDFLDPDDQQDERWREVVMLTQHSENEGLEVRNSARRFAAHRADLHQWIDKLAEPRVYEWQIEQEEEGRRRRAHQADQWAEHRANYTQHLTEVVRGDHGSVIHPAKAYLKLFQDMGDEAADGPSRLVEWLGTELAAACLVGFEAFLNRSPPQPSAHDIMNSHVESRHWGAAYIIVAALAERLRKGVGFEDLPDERLMAGLFEIFCTKIDDHAGISGLEEALTTELRTRGTWEEALRLFFDPQFAHRLSHVERLYPFLRDESDVDLAIKFAMEWLSSFPDMLAGPESELIDLLLRSGRSETLIDLQATRLSDAKLDNERRRNWRAVALIVDFEGAHNSSWAQCSVEPELLWHLRARTGARRRESGIGELDAAQLNWAISTFRPLYAWSRHPSTSSGDTNAWDATDHLNSLIGRLGNYTSDDAIAYLCKLRDAPTDGYTEHLRVVAAEQRRNRIEAEFHSPTLGYIKAVVNDSAPTEAVQLQQVIVEELAMVQAKIRGSDVDWYDDFTTDTGVPRVEDDCRDTILKIMRPLPFQIQALPEGHIADDKRCDIICLLGDLMVPIEVKGQWHPELWLAADKQLDHLYVNDWRAERGIYLVLWFGPGTTKPLKKPPTGVSIPTTPEALRLALRAGSSSAQTDRLEVIVLDLVRPST